MDTVYAFGPFRLETSAEILFRGAAALPIGRRAVGVLRALLEHPGVPVSKDALMQAGWPGLAVEENNLTVQIAALRRVLMEEPGGERWIETLPRRGYRFVGPMIAHPEDSAVIDRLMPTAPLAALERRRDPPSALPGDSGILPKDRTDLGYAASDPGFVVEEVDRDLSM
jgi:DNA-binding winged helix-turn-helix (wHTH) protein